MTDTTNRDIRFDFPFAEDAAKSFTLPADYYLSSELYEDEKAAIFYASWNFVAHSSRVKQPGEFVTAQIHDQNVFVMRGKDGELRGFYNVCQHRGHELLRETGGVKAIVCPYHGWSYETDGRLRHARNSENVEGFDKCLFSLKQIRVEEYASMVFVNIDGQAQPIREQAPHLAAELLELVPALADLKFVHRHTYEVAANWKILIDNFLECYHCHTAHRDFVDLVDMPTYRSKICDIHSSHISTGAPKATSSAYSVLQDDSPFSYAGWFLWPNLSIWLMPGEPNFLTLQMVPVGPEKTIEYLDWHLASDDLSPQVREAMVYLDEVLQPEDIGLCESVQRGLKSFGYNQGRFVVDKNESELSEHAVHHFQKMVLAALR